jgi:hypothetical protein
MAVQHFQLDFSRVQLQVQILQILVEVTVQDTCQSSFSFKKHIYFNGLIVDRHGFEQWVVMRFWAVLRNEIGENDPMMTFNVNRSFFVQWRSCGGS